MAKNRTPDHYPSSIAGQAETLPLRHVLPKDLGAAIRQLDDQELDRLVSAALEERSRRRKGRSFTEAKLPTTKDETLSGFLPKGKLNAVLAAFRPCRTSKQC
jgi:hypothetical protein